MFAFLSYDETAFLTGLILLFDLLVLFSQDESTTYKTSLDMVTFALNLGRDFNPSFLLDVFSDRPDSLETSLLFKIYSVGV